MAGISPDINTTGNDSYTFFRSIPNFFGALGAIKCAKIKRLTASVGYQIVNCFFPQAVNIYEPGI